MEGNADDISLWNEKEAVGREREVSARKSPLRPVGLGIE